MSDNVKELLRGFDVPHETLWELKRCFEKRQKTKVSEFMSIEAKVAIQQTRDEFLVKRDVNFNLGPHEKSRKKDAQNRMADRRGANSKHCNPRGTSFSEAYDKSGSRRLKGDITDAKSPTDKKLGDNPPHNSGTGSNAKETAETGRDTRTDNRGADHDDLAIAETAKRNSVEKCIVWMEVNNADTDKDTDKSTTVTKDAGKSASVVDATDT